MRSELTPIIQRVQGMINYVRENLDEQEYDLFLDFIVPESEVKKTPARKAKTLRFEHCDVCNYTKRHQVHKDGSRTDYHEFQSAQGSSKSKRAKSLGEAIQKTPKVKGDDDNDISDFDMSSLCNKCGKPADENHHHLATHPDYHEFVEGKSHALTAGGE